MNIIVIAKGQFPVLQSVLDLVECADIIVCCDGAFDIFFHWWQRTMSSRRQVDVVGDGDSFSLALFDEARQAGLKVRRMVVSEQESNDLSKAVHYVIGQARGEGVDDSEIHLDILGATGLREDHTLGNISLLAYYCTLYPRIEFRMLSDYGMFLPVRGYRSFKSYLGQQVSVFSLTPQVPVSVRGLRYPIENRCLLWLWEGTLNESISDTFDVTGGILVVYQEG